MFAGTGALGFELASRGARSVVLVESHREAFDLLQATHSRLAASQVELIAGDAFAVAARLPEASFDIVFLDPPFEAPTHGDALAAARRLVRPEGLIYLESPAPLSDEQLRADGLQLVRRGRAGRVAFHLLRPATA